MFAAPTRIEAGIGRRAVLRSGAWLPAHRARAYGWALLIVSSVVAMGWVALSPDGIDPAGKPIGADFTSFWSAARLALSGAPAKAYDVAAHHAQESAIFGRDTGYSAFFYPPIFLVICLPLGLLPYLAALVVWLSATGLAYWRAARAWLGERFGAMPILAFPAVLINAGHGQNGFLSAALLGAGALWLDDRPILAGVCLGALAYKPQLGLMIPLALALGARWRTIAAAAATVLSAVAMSLALFGASAWQGFLADSHLARATLEQGLVGDAKMQSLFAAVRLWDGPLWLAYGAQAALALGAAAGLVWLHRRGRADTRALGAAMVAASLIASPFLLDYDLAVLAIPLAWMLREAQRTGFRDWEKTVMAAAFVLPAVSRILATQARLALAPLVMSALFVLVLRRAGASPAAG